MKNVTDFRKSNTFLTQIQILPELKETTLENKLIKCSLSLKCNIPDKATTPVTESPTSWNFVIITERLSVGAGRAVFGRVALAVVLSLLPNCTFQDGPPDCTI